MDEMILDVNSMSCNFHFFNLNNISFQLYEGYISCVVGENASGKSALLETLAGLHNNYKGKISVSGKMGTIFRDKLTCGRGSLAAITKKYEKTADEFSKDTFLVLLKKYGLNEDDIFSRLSEANKWIFWILLNMSSNVKLLVIDEPFAFLNKEGINMIKKVLQEFVEDGKRSVILATNNFGDIESVVDYFGIMSDGKMLLFGERDEILSRFSFVSGETKIIDLIPSGIILYRKKNSVKDEAVILNKSIDDELADRTVKTLKLRKPTFRELFFSIVKAGTNHCIHILRI